MTQPEENRVSAIHSGKDQKDWSRHSAKHEAEPGKLDDLADEYIPMDVFVDLETRKDQFHVSSVRGRKIKIH